MEGEFIMPMPKPKTGESKDDFLGRCMGDDVMVEDYSDNDQRYTVCNDLWDKEKKKKKKSFLEARSYPFEISEIREMTEDEPLKITGYAAVFNQLSDDLGGFREKIKRGFFKDVLDNDVRALFNHDDNMVLARTKNNTLKLEEDNKGLKVEIIPNDTTYANDLVKLVRRGDVDQMSFQWVTEKDEWDSSDLNNVVRTLVKAQSLWDVSPVTFPAYPQTKVDVRTSRQVYKAYLEELLEDNFGGKEKDDGKWQERISLIERELTLLEKEF